MNFLVLVKLAKVGLTHYGVYINVTNCVMHFYLEQKNADGDQTDLSNKHNEPRLQRSRAQSRKIFRFRQSRRMEVT